MNIIEKIKADYIIALKEKNILKKEILNYVISQIKNKQIDSQSLLNNEDVFQIIRKEIKTRFESIVYLEKVGDNNSINEEKNKIEILEQYLPKMLTKDETLSIIEDKISSLGIQDLKKDRGKLIGSIMEEYRGVIDGKSLNEIINSKI